MKVVIRADASVEIGMGHVMRCLTLACHLKERGAEIWFMCVDMPGHLAAQIDALGMEMIWLTPAEALDLSVVRRAVASLAPFDLLILDSYGLDAAWESEIRSIAQTIMVIDDLGRPHNCDVLLDQNYPSPIHNLYAARTPADCELLFGPQYALLRPEFATLRATSLWRPRSMVSRLLVFMGGSDPRNETSKVLRGIVGAKWMRVVVDVVIGTGNPYVRDIRAACADLPNATLHIQTSRMADLMAAADCAVGASGSTTWERCALGLPGLVTILADNQAPIAEAVAAAGGHQLLGWYDRLTPEDYTAALLALDVNKLGSMSQAAARICDGRGAERVAARLVAYPASSHRRNWAN